MKASNIQVGQEYIVHIPGSERQNRRWPYTPEGYLRSEVRATVLAKDIVREGRNRSGGVRVQISEEAWSRMPDRYADRLTTQDEGLDRTWVIHSRSVKRSAVDQLHDEALRVDADWTARREADRKYREKAGPLDKADVGKLMEADEEKASRTLRSYRDSLIQFERYIKRELELIDSETEEVEYDLKPVEGGSYPTMGRRLPTDDVQRRAKEYTACAGRANLWREVRERKERNGQV